MSLKNPVTPWGIDPGTVRLVAQRLNHSATSDPGIVNRVRDNGSNPDFGQRSFSAPNLSDRL